MILKYLIVILLVLCWAVTPFCKKKAMNNLNKEEYFTINFILTSFLAALFVSYLIYNKKINISVFKKLNSTEWIWAWVSASLSIFAALFLLYLIKFFEVSHIIPQLNPCVGLFTLIIGIIIFQESFTVYKIIGGLLLMSGLFVINFGK